MRAKSADRLMGLVLTIAFVFCVFAVVHVTLRNRADSAERAGERELHQAKFDKTMAELEVTNRRTARKLDYMSGYLDGEEGRAPRMP